MDKIYDVNDIADYIILVLNQDEDFPLPNLKLQKLVYYVQAWALGIMGKRFMNEKFQAWIHGPVSPILYTRFKSTKTLYASIRPDDVINKDVLAIFSTNSDDARFINFILENYAGCSSNQLEAMSHSEDPWIEARKGYRPTERCTEEISEETMQKYYGSRWQEINKR